MTEPANPDIVVVGTRQSNGASLFVRTSGVPTGIRYVSPAEVSENPDGDLLQIVVRLDRSTGDLAAMQRAAEALIKAIARAVDLLGRIDPSRVVAVLGIAISVGAILNAIQTTTFIITDRSDFGNNGVGGADYGARTDQINYAAIVGDATHPAYYDHPNFTNGEGMLALLFHEALHLTDHGNTFYLQSVAAWANNATFYGSPHGDNLERFMNALTMQLLAAAGVPTRSEAPPLAPLTPPVPIDSLSLAR